MIRRRLLLLGALAWAGVAAAEEPARPGTAGDWRRRWTDPFESERYVEVITAEEIRASNARNLPDLLRRKLVAWMTFANYAGGSPTIRGLDGFDVTILLDDVPIPTSAYRFGELEFLSTIDLYLIERVEIVPGTAATVAGWSAGPVVRLFTRRAVPASPAGDESGDDDPQDATAARTMYRFATVDKSSVAHLEAGRQGDRFGFSIGISSRDIGDLKAGGDIGFQRVTGYEDVAGNARIQYFLSPHRTVELDIQLHEQQNVPQFERLETGTFIDFRLNPRKRALFEISYLDATHRAWAHRLEASIYLNQHRQRSFEQLAARPEIRTQGSDNDDIEGFALRLDLDTDRHRLSYGADYSRERVDAVRREVETLTGDELSRGADRTRDGQERELLSIWARDRVALLESLSLVAAGRYTAMSIGGPYSGPAGTLALDLEEGGLAATLGVVWEIGDRFDLTAAWDTGFRLPTLDEVTGSSPDPELVGVPNDDLEALSIDALELGLRYRTERLELRAAWFLAEAKEVPEPSPASVGGSTFVDLDRDGVRNGGEPSFRRFASSGRADLEGFDLALRFRPLEALEIFGTLHIVEGDDPSAGVPLTGIPPTHGRVGVEWSPGWRFDPSVRAELRFHDRKSRLSPLERTDPSLDPFILDGTEILEITAGATVTERLRFLFSLENPNDEAYRPFGSFLFAGGRNLAMMAEYVF